ncbi:hypothetical protein HNO89_003740 [Sporosarcina luteola]|nr:hypothetical protein [Sporosarcina luteola]
MQCAVISITCSLLCAANRGYALVDQAYARMNRGYARLDRAYARVNRFTRGWIGVMRG